MTRRSRAVLSLLVTGLLVALGQLVVVGVSQADIGYTAFFGGRTYSGTDPVPPGVDINPDPNVTTLSTGSTSQSQDFATSANPNKDRDFLAVSLSYAF